MSHQHNALGSPCLSHLRRQRVSPIYHGSLISLYLCFQMFILVAGAFQVQGPHEPMVAMLGGEAELSCILVPRQSTKYMKISWTRTLPSQVVHLYEDGQDKPEKAMEEYLGRTQLVKNVMHKGIMVLRILNVQPSDSGQYRCVIQHGSFYSEAVIELKVAALGSRPQFHMEVTKSRELQLECKSEGWFPQPKVQWTDSEGGEIPADSETQTQDKGGLFHVTTSLSLRETSQKNLTCSVWNPVLNQKKREQFSTAGHCQSNSNDQQASWGDRLAGGLVRDDRRTEQRAVGDDQAGRGAVMGNQASRGDSEGQPYQHRGQLGATRLVGGAVRDDQASRGGQLGAIRPAGRGG
ncbi:Butyrophilin subfamily 1 member A1 [Myotis brandtii]|uniref:Butyrophilin subfamily 1 member A1 n=1 Tax=Myotis brandtii TaxID=109478 RepID=S7MCY9_MYOBR|nr:Butyrophilin subfamily 1 member A1 [Myotis brandtii]